MFLSGACNVQVLGEEILLKNGCKKDPSYILYTVYTQIKQGGQCSRN